jgi:hypothetical protein
MHAARNVLKKCLKISYYYILYFNLIIRSTWITNRWKYVGLPEEVKAMRGGDDMLPLSPSPLYPYQLSGEHSNKEPLEMCFPILFFFFSL